MQQLVEERHFRDEIPADCFGNFLRNGNPIRNSNTGLGRSISIAEQSESSGWDQAQSCGFWQGQSDGTKILRRRQTRGPAESSAYLLLLHIPEARSQDHLARLCAQSYSSLTSL